MPTFHIELFEGRSLEQKRQFVEAITKATCESLGVEPNSVDIILTDVKRENWATGGRLWSDSGFIAQRRMNKMRRCGGVTTRRRYSRAIRSGG